MPTVALAARIPPGTTDTRLALTRLPTPLGALPADWPGIAPNPAAVPSSGFGWPTTATLVRVRRRIGPGPPALGRGKLFLTGTIAALPNDAALIPAPVSLPKMGNAEPFNSAAPLGAALSVLVVARSGGRRGATGEAFEMSASSAEPPLTSRSGDSVDLLDTALFVASGNALSALLEVVPSEVERGIGLAATDGAGFASGADGVVRPSDRSSHSVPELLPASPLLAPAFPSAALLAPRPLSSIEPSPASSAQRNFFFSSTMGSGAAAGRADRTELNLRAAAVLARRTTGADLRAGLLVETWERADEDDVGAANPGRDDALDADGAERLEGELATCMLVEREMAGAIDARRDEDAVARLNPAEEEDEADRLDAVKAGWEVLATLAA